MSRYRTISVKMWGDDRFSRLSKPQPNAQTLWIYLLTGEHTTAFPGVSVAGEAGLAEALKWPLKAFRKAFAEVLREGLAEWDSDTRLLFIPKAIRHNPPQSPNVVVSWRKVFNELPDCPLKQVIFESTRATLAALGLGEAYLKAFGEAFVYTFVESEQDQDQDQEQDHEQSQEAFGQFANVRLSPDEKRKLDEQFGAEGSRQRIEALSEGIASKGYKYSSHYATILSWERKNGNGAAKRESAAERAERLNNQSRLRSM